MDEPRHTVAVTDEFLKDCKAASVSHAQLDEIVNALAAQPAQGDLIVGSGGARKVRIAGRGKGKSGGFRLITGYLGPDIPVYAFALFGKEEKANISKADISDLHDVLAALKAYWKEPR
ncbi:MAG TPA: type II toxin-antitoxin system RelE/ParE family toxin [Caulobacterales bacterium]|nr:type II toxin-antitoxin system RelE/ParE family toxin [Caulobacterales bacterium]